MEKLKLTKREIACIVWNTMYGASRRPFSDISEDAKDDWTRFVELTLMVNLLNLSDDPKSQKAIKEIKKFQKL